MGTGKEKTAAHQKAKSPSEKSQTNEPAGKNKGTVTTRERKSPDTKEKEGRK